MSDGGGGACRDAPGGTGSRGRSVTAQICSEIMQPHKRQLIEMTEMPLIDHRDQPMRFNVKGKTSHSSLYLREQVRLTVQNAYAMPEIVDLPIQMCGV